MTFYVHNNGTSEVALEVMFDEYVPLEITQFLNHHWASDETQTIQPNQTKPVMLEMSVPFGVSWITSFSFKVILKITEMDGS